MPISHPFVYSIYLAKMLGPFATLGLAEDTWALNERVIDEQAFLEQALAVSATSARSSSATRSRRRRRASSRSSSTPPTASSTCSTATSTRRTRPTRARTSSEWADVIPRDLRADGRAARRGAGARSGDPDTVLMVISDHGFTNFRRGVNLNTWLRDNGYLVAEGRREHERRLVRGRRLVEDAGVHARAHGLFINRKGRETQRHRRARAPSTGRSRTSSRAKLEALRRSGDGRARDPQGASPTPRSSTGRTARRARTS